MRLTLVLALVATPAFADLDRVLTNHILPGHQRLADSTDALAAAAQADCTPGTLHPAFHTAYDAWIGISHIQFGPIEDDNLALAMAFWPDPKDNTGKALGRLMADADPIVDDPESFAQVSIAAQGFTALERLLFEPQDDPAYACRLTRAVSTGLARKSAHLAAAWGPNAALLRDPGSNTRYQSDDDVQRALYTALSTGLEFLHDQRLGGPLGTFDRPRPRRAEARRSARSLDHIRLSLAALEDLATLMTDTPMPKTQKAFATARARAAEIDDPALQGVADPTARFRIEVLQQQVRAIQIAVVQELGAPLGIRAGFNALDGD